MSKEQNKCFYCNPIMWARSPTFPITQPSYAKVRKDNANSMEKLVLVRVFPIDIGIPRIEST